jgi:hypothetical protein
VATAFNLLFEYSLRGLPDLVAHPFLPLFLLPIYLIYFAMVEDLIVRYRLRDVHLMLIAFFFGVIGLLLISGGAFVNPTFLGINWPTLIFVNIVWWGALQTVLTFYLANRVAPRNWNHPRLSRKVWALLLAGFALIVVAFQSSGQIPRGSATAVTVLLGLLILTAWLLKRSLPRPEERSGPPPAFRRDAVLDILSVLTILLFAFSAIFLTFDPTVLGPHRVNYTALIVISIWTSILAIVMLIRRLQVGPISV